MSKLETLESYHFHLHKFNEDNYESRFIVVNGAVNVELYNYVMGKLLHLVKFWVHIATKYFENLDMFYFEKKWWYPQWISGKKF